MSTQVEVQDEEAFSQAIADLRSDTAGVGRKSWLLCGHVDNNPNQICLITQDVSEDASLDDFVEKLEDDQVMYGLLRISTTLDMSNTVKFIYVHWIGDNVPFAKKGRFGVVHGSMESRFVPYHIQIETGNQSDLQLEEITRQLEESNFTRSHIVEGGNMAGRQDRGTVKTSNKVDKRVVVPNVAAINMTSELTDAIADVRNDKLGPTWVLAGFEGGSLKKPLTLIAQGEGDIEELKQNLVDDQVMYSLYRTGDVVDDMPLVKYVYLCWVGDDVKPITMGQASTMSGPVEREFSPFHVGLFFRSAHEMDQSVIEDKVKASSGSKSFVK